MIDAKTKLTVKHDANSVFTDYTDNAADFLRDDFSITLASATDYLYVGLTKPFGAFYAQLTTANTNANTLSAEIYDGTSWVSVDLSDESKGFTRSGFCFWDKTSMASATIDGDAAYYIRLRPSADHSATDLRGINLIFSDDNQLKAEFFEIDDSSLLPAGENSHISKHVSARNRILQELRRLKYKTQVGTAQPQLLDQWDVIDVFEIREAATHLALSEVFFNLSDSLEDHWWVKYKDHQGRAQALMSSVPEISIDSDDDGKDDDDEVLRPIKVSRWNR